MVQINTNYGLFDVDVDTHQYTQKQMIEHTSWCSSSRCDCVNTPRASPWNLDPVFQNNVHKSHSNPQQNLQHPMTAALEGFELPGTMANVWAMGTGARSWKATLAGQRGV